MRRIALRDFWFSASVFNSTRKQFQTSKAWRSIRYLASVFTAVRCHAGAIHVEPIFHPAIDAVDVHEASAADHQPGTALDGCKHDRLAAFLLVKGLLHETLKVFARLYAVVNGEVTQTHRGIPSLTSCHYLASCVGLGHLYYDARSVE